jgi:hypothetical protein
MRTCNLRQVPHGHYFHVPQYPPPSKIPAFAAVSMDDEGLLAFPTRQGRSRFRRRATSNVRRKIAKSDRILRPVL